MAMFILAALGLILLKLSLNILVPRQWALQQTVTDAYMTYERAYAQRIPFETITAANSPWPLSPATAQSTVELGRRPGDGLPEDRVITGTVYRTRIEDNSAATSGTNPAGMKIWRLQSVVSYKIGKREYLKSRTVVRTQ